MNNKSKQESAMGWGLYTTLGLGVLSIIIVLIFFYIKSKQ